MGRSAEVSGQDASDGFCEQFQQTSKVPGFVSLQAEHVKSGGGGRGAGGSSP